MTNLDNRPQGWYSRQMGPQRINEKRVFKLNSFRWPSLIFGILAVASIALGITNLVITSTVYFRSQTTGQMSNVWVLCNPNASSIITPNNEMRGKAFWLYACIGLVIGIWCFLTAIWAALAYKQSQALLRALRVVLVITFFGCLAQAILATLDIVSSFSCLDTAKMTTNDNVKVSMPFFLIILASIKTIVNGVLYNLVGDLIRFREEEMRVPMTTTPSRALRYQGGPAVMRHTPGISYDGNQNFQKQGFSNWMGVGRPAPYTNFQSRW